MPFFCLNSDKNILVTAYVQQRGFARLKLHHSLLRQPSLADTRHFSIPRYIRSVHISHVLIDPTISSSSTPRVRNKSTYENAVCTRSCTVSKRLPCVIPIHPGRIDHLNLGPHCHSSEKDPFHFCEARYRVFLSIIHNSH